MMNKTRLLSISVVALLFINLVLLLFFYLQNTPKERPRKIVIDQLKFDEMQIAEYDKLIKNHKSNIRIIDDSIRVTRNQMYKLLNEENIDIQKRGLLIKQFANYQQQIEMTHFNHFLEIKKLCKKEQLADYEKLTTELSKIFNNQRKQRTE